MTATQATAVAGVGHPVAVIGAGFCGLSAAYELSRRGIPVTVYERDPEVGGLAGSFAAGSTRLDKYYHHWFASDEHVTNLIDELGCTDLIHRSTSRTGLYFADRHYRLSSPRDLLRFEALPWVDRLRLGLMTIRARRTRDWQALEPLTATEWALRLAGPRVLEVVWRPLLEGKFGEHADDISAVWLWNKMKLRGGSRDGLGREHLAYFEGGFGALAEMLAERVRQQGGLVRTGHAVEALQQQDGRVTGVVSGGETQAASAVLATSALPEIADLLEPHLPSERTDALRRIRYLGNVCVVLELNRSLSDVYWLNVSDRSFPFVGIVEHTNLEPASAYEGRHIVYLSRYLPETSDLYRMDDGAIVDFSLSHLRRVYPAFSPDWLIDGHVWRARYSQPVVERGYGSLLDDIEVPLEGFHIATMAQIYPQDRGTNYAIRQGREAARGIAVAWEGRSHAPRT